MVAALYSQNPIFQHQQRQQETTICVGRVCNFNYGPNQIIRGVSASNKKDNKQNKKTHRSHDDVSL